MTINVIDEVLKDETEGTDFVISNEERLTLIDVLAFVSSALSTGKLYFETENGRESEKFATFCKVMAKRFANMPIKQEQ